MIDGFMALFMGILMLLYSPLLTLISAVFVAIFVIFRLTFFRLMRQMSESTIVASAKADSNFMETVRGIQSIKVFGKEADRQRLWKKHFLDVIGTNTRLGMFSANISAAESMLSTLETALIVFIGANFVINGSFTPGMFIAFFSYHGQFSGKALSLLENLLDYKMLDLHLSRLADIVLSPIHKKTQSLGIGPAKEQAAPTLPMDLPMEGSLRIENLGFRFGADDPWLFRNLSITVKPGECVVIAGPSGCGKSTLAKIILGLINPVEGSVFIGGHPPLKFLGKDNSLLSSGVMQEDQLFSGTIADNLTFFDPIPDESRLHQSARLAAIETEIMGMPMGYHSLLGDMGSVLSTGQKQRLLLARALYAQPKILVLDEATCHLDSGLEQTLLATLSSLPITRIIITHRPQTIAFAHHRIALGSQNPVQPTLNK